MRLRCGGSLTLEGVAHRGKHGQVVTLRLTDPNGTGTWEVRNDNSLELCISLKVFPQIRKMMAMAIKRARKNG